MLLVIGSALVTPLYAFRLPDSCLAWPVLLDDNASGVYLQHQGSVYLVTARGVLFDPEDGRLTRSRITLRSYARDPSIHDPIVFELDLAALEESHRILSGKAGDVAAVIIGTVANQQQETFYWEGAPGLDVQAQPGPVQVILGADEWHRFDDAEVSNEAFIFGYPTSVDMARRLERGRPFSRKGTIADKHGTARHLIVDTLVLPVYLGGPVIEIDEVGRRSWEPKFIGIVVDTIPNQETVSAGQTAVLDNSGSVVVAPVDSILDLIEKHPPGPGAAR